MAVLAWGWTHLEQLARDVRYGLRQVRRNPAFSGIAIATLALGIGVNTAMFSAVDTVLIRPLPYLDADRLVMIWDDMSRTGSFPLHRNGRLMTALFYGFRPDYVPAVAEEGRARRSVIELLLPPGPAIATDGFTTAPVRLKPDTTFGFETTSRDGFTTARSG
jgi:hypothetical protein